MLVISIVKSSLALSLGLVGALSIVRFRTAIKEPEELVYFFVAIAIGLGMGANQRIVTLTGSAVIILYIIIQNYNADKSVTQQNLIISISNLTGGHINENKIIELLEKYCSRIDLKRLDVINDISEISLSVEFKDFESIIKAKNDLKELGDIQFNFIENY